MQYMRTPHQAELNATELMDSGAFDCAAADLLRSNSKAVGSPSCPPAPTTVVVPVPSWPNDPSVLLRDITRTEPLPWAIRAPHGWFCHMCDSTCCAGKIQIVRTQTCWLRKPTIVTQPVEWRHNLQSREDIDRQLVSHITRVLEQTLAPGTAIRWNPDTQRLGITTGPIIDWRDRGNHG